jgi:hypothetical protein
MRGLDLVNERLSGLPDHQRGSKQRMRPRHMRFQLPRRSTVSSQRRDDDAYEDLRLSIRRLGSSAPIGPRRRPGTMAGCPAPNATQKHFGCPREIPNLLPKGQTKRADEVRRDRTAGSEAWEIPRSAASRHPALTLTCREFRSGLGKDHGGWGIKSRKDAVRGGTASDETIRKETTWLEPDDPSSSAA